MPEQQPTEQLSLPYREIKESEVAGRDYLRANFKISGKVVYKMPFSIIQVRENFNSRKVFDDIPELADDILENGQKEPFEVDVLTDGTVFLKDGERRYRATQLIIERGIIVDEVECFISPKRTTELERLLSQHTGNLKSKLKPLEAATIAYRIKHNFGLNISNEEIGKKMALSRQTVDNLLILHDADDQIKEQIKTGNLSVKDALSLIANDKKLKRMLDKEETKHAQSSMYITPDQKDINAQDLKDSAALETQFPKEETDNDEDYTEVPEGEEPVRTTTNISGERQESSKPLELVGNSVAQNATSKKEDDGGVVYDKSRPEIASILNCIGLADKIEAVVNRLDVPDGTKTDLQNFVKWMQKDLDEVRSWVHSNKKQNKTR